MTNALGMLEVQGYSVALAAMDKACKAANVTITGMDCNNPTQGDSAPIPVVVQVKFTGEISDVRVALEVARYEASRLIDEKDVLTRLIPKPFKGLEKLLSAGKVKLK
mgnify:CR=1 FL=1